MVYERNADLNLWHRPVIGEFGYADGGDSESRLLDVVKGAQDRSTFSAELRTVIANWSLEYHLSRQRHCLLRPLDIRPNQRVLELGCGCGAITRYLGESGADVVSVEGSLARAKVTAERVRDLPNVKVYVDDLQRFESDLQFDWVLLIGVLEYSPVFSDADDPFRAYLDQVAQYVSPMGRLVVAIENQLGLKYFNAATEDHLGKAFVGVQGIYSRKSPTTLGRKALSEKLQQSGFQHQRFYYPYPDYKLPQIILSEDACRDDDFRAADLLLRIRSRDYSGWPYRLFDEGLVSRVLEDNGLLEEMSNSFLITASRSSGIGMPDRALAWAYSVDRAPEFITETSFERRAGTGAVEVVKRRLLVEDCEVVSRSSGTITLSHRATTDRYVFGDQVYLDLLCPLANRTGVDASFVGFLPWFQWLVDQAWVGDTADPSCPQTAVQRLFVSGRMIDALPFNLIRVGSELRQIDLEWSVEGKLSAGMVVLRGVSESLNGTLLVSPAAEHGYELITRLFASIGYDVTSSDFEYWQKLASQFRTIAAGGEGGQYVGSGRGGALSILAALSMAGAKFENATECLRLVEGNLANVLSDRDELRQTLIALTQARAELPRQAKPPQAGFDQGPFDLAAVREQLDRTQSRVDEILASKAWRMAEPYRLAERKAKLFIRRALGATANDGSASALKTITLAKRRLHQLYLLAPVSWNTRLRIKRVVFKALAPALRQTEAYRAWLASEGRAGELNRPYQEGVSPKPSMEGDNSDFVPFREMAMPADLPVRLIALYLPQFHPILENDEWWGRGFTEWTNVTRAVPQFDGHYQPHLPADLGFYDLRLPDVMRQQVDMAKAYGIGGFCFYFYWFGGKRLLELPILQYLADSALDFPFCLCWANENWSRRWDGLDSELLIAQRHSEEDDLRFIEYLSVYLRDARYIRVDGKPLVIVYRPGLLPDPLATSQRWRQWCRDSGIGEIHLAYTQSLETAPPERYGFDAAIEFPPNNSAPPNITAQIKPYDAGYSGLVYDWNIFLERSRRYQRPDYLLYRSVCPSWDNEARKPGRGTVFLNSTPAKYGEWLRNAIVETVNAIESADNRLVFVNAWNEWAEGAHLEPDRRYGYAWLEATRRAMLADAVGQRRIVVVSHDAHPHGAQYLALSIVKVLRAQFRLDVAVVLLGGGPLAEAFASAASECHQLSIANSRQTEGVDLARRLRAVGYRAAIVNTTVAGDFLKTLSEAGLRCLSLVHELPGVLEDSGLRPQMQAIAAAADVVVFPAPEVQAGFESFGVTVSGTTCVRPQGLYKRNNFRHDRQYARSRLRAEFGLSESTKIVLSVGYADHRKGVDLFVEIGRRLAETVPELAMIWVGHWSSEMRAQLEPMLDGLTGASVFHFVGRRDDTELFYAGADVYALTSREDPFPSTVLESLDAALPVVAFEDTGGMASLLATGLGVVVERFSTQGFATAVQSLFDDAARAAMLGEQGQLLIRSQYSFRHYLFDLLDQLGVGFARVSVVVPNYNYARFIEQRLASVAAQQWPIYELIVLDDRSSDDSVEVVSRWLEQCDVDGRLVVNDSNSGSAFLQWKKGVELSRGQMVWVAEADDLADPELLTTLVEKFEQNPDVVMAYAESRQMATDGKILAPDYSAYVADVSPTRWRSPYVDAGMQEVRTALAIKNTIPNVSAALFQRQVLCDVLNEHIDQIRRYRVAGDWVVYTLLLGAPQRQIAFEPRALNLHRRHEASITVGSFDIRQLAEIIAVQSWIAREHAVDAQTVARAREYAQQLYEQFGLRTDDSPRCEDNEALMALVAGYADSAGEPH